MRLRRWWRPSIETDKGHGRIEERVVSVATDASWLRGDRRFPGELRMPGAASLIRVCSTARTGNARRRDTRYFIASGCPNARTAANAVRGHWLIENALHWVLDVVFKDDLSRIRKGHGAHNMAIVRHFAINLVRTVKDKRSIKARRKRAAFSTTYLEQILGPLAR